MRPTTEAQVREYRRKNGQDDQGFAVSLRVAIPAGISVWTAYTAFAYFVALPLVRLAIG